MIAEICFQFLHPFDTKCAIIVARNTVAVSCVLEHLFNLPLSFLSLFSQETRCMQMQRVSSFMWQFPKTNTSLILPDKFDIVSVSQFFGGSQ